MTTSKTTSKRSIKNADQLVNTVQQQGGNHLGDVVLLKFWNGTTPHANLVAAATQSGFPLDLLPAAMDEKSAFLWTVKRVKVPDYLVRKIDDTAEKLVYGVVREDALKKKEDLKYHVEARITLVKATGGITTDAPNHPVVTATKAMWKGLVGTVPTWKMRCAIRALSRTFQGVAVGSTFFVPGAHAELLRALQPVVHAMGQSQMWLLPMYDSPDTRDSLSRAARASIEEALAELADEMDTFGNDTQSGTLRRRLEQFEAIQKRASLYSGILQVAYDDLGKRMTDMQAKLAGLLGVRQDAADDKAAAKAASKATKAPAKAAAKAKAAPKKASTRKAKAASTTKAKAPAKAKAKAASKKATTAKKAGASRSRKAAAA